MRVPEGSLREASVMALAYLEGPAEGARGQGSPSVGRRAVGLPRAVSPAAWYPWSRWGAENALLCPKLGCSCGEGESLARARLVQARIPLRPELGWAPHQRLGRVGVGWSEGVRGMAESGLGWTVSVCDRWEVGPLLSPSPCGCPRCACPLGRKLSLGCWSDQTARSLAKAQESGTVWTCRRPRVAISSRARPTAASSAHWLGRSPPPRTSGCHGPPRAAWCDGQWYRHR